MIADSSDKDIRIRELMEENTKLKEKLSTTEQSRTTTQIAENAKKVQADKSTEAKTWLLPDLPRNNNVETLLQNIQKTFDKKITDLKDVLLVSVDEKFKQHKQEIGKPTYASTASTKIAGNQATQQESSTMSGDVQSF